MLADETRKRQDRLNNLIQNMAEQMYVENSSEADTALSLLQDIYTNNFKHNYSEFFPLILDISKENELDYLSNNLELLRISIENDYTSGINKYRGLFDPLRKLCDHLNLEIARYNYYSKNENAIHTAEQEVKRLEIQTKNALRELKAASNKTKSLQSEMIAVLSIFAAVIISFFGGANYISSAIASLQAVHVYKSVTTALIVGIVLFNTIFLLMYIVSKIIDRNIYALCKTENCSCDNKCNAIGRVKKRMPYVFWANLFFVILLSITCVIWYFVNAPI